MRYLNLRQYKTLRDAVALMRPRQWFKSVFVVAPYFFSGLWTSHAWKALVAILAFGFAASAVYTYNDINDIDLDRHHPSKRYGLIASGRMTLEEAWAWVLIFNLISLLCCYLLSISALLIAVVYILINLLYTHRLKYIPYVDILCISAGFMLRLLMGSVGIGILPSYDLISCGVALSVFLAMSKRYLEYQGLRRSERDYRPVLQGYSVSGIIIVLCVASAAFIASYIDFTIHKSVKLVMGQWLWLTVIMVTLGVVRYCVCLYQGRDVLCPIRLFIGDKFLVVWLLLTTLLLAKLI